MLLPAGANSTLVSLVSTDTLTNKTLTSPKINEDVAVTSTATELNLLDGKAATNLALIGKTEGTNFTGSLLVGHATTGTLSSAESNTGIGISALDALTSGDGNTLIGASAGTAITGGSGNIGIGKETLKSITNGDNNTAIGGEALELATGSGNIGLGFRAGDNITGGAGNVIIGSINADSATGDKQLIIADGTDGSVAWIKGSSAGVVTFADDIIIKDAGTIGSASDVDAIAIASNGVVTFSQTPVNSAGAAFVTDDPTALAIALG